MRLLLCSFFFFFNDTATTEIYTLSLHDALPISRATTSASPMVIAPRYASSKVSAARGRFRRDAEGSRTASSGTTSRSEEHTSELQSLAYLVCRLLLEKKKK